MTVEENLAYFDSLSSMLPKIIFHDNSEVISNKYSHKPSGNKKRKLKESQGIVGESIEEIKKPKKAKKHVTPISVEQIPSLPYDELKQRLKQKIEQSNQMKASKRDKLKEKRKESKMKAKKKPHVEKTSSIITKASLVDATKEKPKKCTTSTDKIQFSKFESKTKEDITLASMKKRRKKKDLNKMLGEAKEEKKKLKTLQKSSDEKDASVLNEKTWSKALSMARGEKQKDNPELIAKAIKRKEQKKKKSTKEWTKRVGGQKKLQKEKQKKRQENIEKRKEAKKSRR